MAGILKAGTTAVITGGASGIGLALARKCAVECGMKVLVADKDPKTLAAVPSNIAAAKVQMDVSKAEDWTTLKQRIEQVFDGKITFLALNAGIQQKCSWDSAEAFQSTMNTNLFGVINGITTLLPLVRAAASSPSSPAAIVITGSKQGITCPPGNPAYNASKAAVKMLAEHLSYDLRDTPISVHLLVPGWTWTGLAGGVPGAGRDSASAEKPDAPWWPEEVADYLVDKMDKKQFYVLCPDNEVTEEVDRKRMLWTTGDAVNGRPPMSRWRDEYKEEFAEFMKN